MSMKMYVIAQIVILQLLLTTTMPALSAVILSKRAIEEYNSKTECASNTPCGWAIYTPFTRKIDYFMKNSCDCAEKKKCIRSDDDISVSAFVYRCKDQPHINTTAPAVTS